MKLVKIVKKQLGTLLSIPVPQKHNRPMNVSPERIIGSLSVIDACLYTAEVPLKVVMKEAARSWQ